MLVTDLYELTMAAAYHRSGMVGPATFSLFVRRLPPGRGFLVAAGVDEALDRVTSWVVSREDVTWLAGQGITPELLEPLVDRPFDGDVWAVPEGSVVLADEPLLEVTAPLPQAQLVESTVLNAITYQTAIATKAALCTLAAGGRAVVDFSLRRDHGVEAAVSAARAGAIAGFTATSDVAAAQLLGLRATGTMAHSYVQAVGDEREAFDLFAETFPAFPTFLVDTFDTATAVRTATEVIRAHGLERVAAVRLDSGDLAAEARLARRLLDEAGLDGVRIVVSGGVDERVIDDLVRAGAPVDVFAVGTKVGTAADTPYLDSAYKLVEYDGRPVTKLSAGKGYPPGPKQVWRGPDGDVLARRTQDAPPGRGPWRALLEPAVRAGRHVRAPATLAEAGDRLAADLAALPARARAVRDPVPAVCRTSAALADLHAQVRAALGGPGPR